MLVSTTVIEVGVDVPNATLMVIYDADRFGLSQLHQLRGRVGRASHQSFCVLIADPKTEMGKERMKGMTETTDGFEIARRDLELRGRGTSSARNRAAAGVSLADLLNDFKELELAREDAAELIRRSDFWTANTYLSLRDVLAREGVLDGEALD